MFKFFITVVLLAVMLVSQGCALFYVDEVETKSTSSKEIGVLGFIPLCRYSTTREAAEGYDGEKDRDMHKGPLLRRHR